MKIYIFFLIFIVFSINSSAQSRIDPQNILDSLTVTDTIFINNSKFRKGWNWSSESRKLDSALLINYNHTGLNSTLLSTGMFEQQNMNYLLQVDGNGSIKCDIGHTQAMAMYYEPLLDDQDKDFPSFIPNDTVGATFGFKFLSDSVFSISQNISHNLKLTPDILTNYSLSELLVLKDPWPSDELYNLRNLDLNGDEIHNTDLNLQSDFSGDLFYLTLRLKALEQIDITNEDDVILTIQLPFKAYSIDSSLNETFYEDYIEFDSIPRTDVLPGAIDSIFTDRGEFIGLSKNNDAHLGVKNTFNITGKMLKRMGPIDNSQEYITISAFFKCDSSNLNIFGLNPPLQNSGKHGIVKHVQDISGNLQRIYDLGINITYKGGLSIAIDWIRIETPQFRKLIRGKLDNQIISNINNELTTINNLRSDIKIDRIFGIDEFWECWYSSQRYYNKLIDGKLTNEYDIYSINPIIMLHATDMNEFWTGANTNFSQDVASPLVRRTDYNNNGTQYLLPIDDRLGFNYGYLGKVDKNGITDSALSALNIRHLYHDTLRSAYETWIDRHSVGFTPYNLYDINKASDIYNLTWNNGTDTNYTFRSTMMAFGLSCYQSFLTRPGLIYGKKPFWGNIWVTDNAKVELSPTDTTFKHIFRPRTAQELRLNIYNNLILGAKGLFYFHGATDHEEESTYIQKIAMGVMRIDPLVDDVNTQMNLPTGIELILDDDIGSDYLNNTEIYKLPALGEHDLKYYLRNTDRFDSLYVNSDRIYVGTKSKRLEINKIHKWIDYVQDTLVKLNLQAWYWKGYKEYYTQNPYNYSPNTNLLSSFINYQGITTKRLFEPNEDENHNYYPEIENRDSSFFDLTLFSYNNKYLYSISNTEYFIGVQNRRTDPLIFNSNTFISGIDTSIVKQMEFYSQAEWEEYMIDNGTNEDLMGVQKDSSWWKEQYWKQLGIREILIPFKKIAFGNGKHIVANELGSNGLDTLDWYYHPDYYDLIKERVLQFDDTLKVILMPGEGKIIKINYKSMFDIGEQEDTCDLCNTVNNFDKFEMNIERVDPDPNDSTCCFKFSLTNNTECEYEDIPIKLNIYSQGYRDYILSFNGEAGTIGSINSKYKYYDINIPADTTIEFAEVCILEGGTEFKVDILVGNEDQGYFKGCNRRIVQKINCAFEPYDCCDSLNNLIHVSHSYQESLNDTILDADIHCESPHISPIKCCNEISIDTSYRSNCIYSIALDLKGNGTYMKEIYYQNRFLPINFSLLTSEVIGELCMITCNVCDSTDPYNVKMIGVHYLGYYGETICVDSIAIQFCCSELDDISFEFTQSPPYFKDISEVDENKNTNLNSYDYNYDFINLKVIPNPNSGIFKLELDNKVKQLYEISIYDAIGNKILSIEQEMIDVGNYVKNINISNQPNGAYFINVNSKIRNITIPIIINK